MNKEDTLDLIIKAFGIYLFIQAVQAIPKMIAGFTIIATVGIDGVKSLFTDANASETAYALMLSQGIGSLGEFLVYLIIAVHLLRSGTWIKKIIGNKQQSKGE